MQNKCVQQVSLSRMHFMIIFICKFDEPIKPFYIYLISTFVWKSSKINILAIFMLKIIINIIFKNTTTLDINWRNIVLSVAE